MKNFRSTVIGFAVLIVLVSAGAAQSLSGSNTVFTDDIAPKAVHGSDIADNAVSGRTVYPDSITGADVNESTLSPRTFFAQVSAAGVVVRGSSAGISAVRKGGGIYVVAFPRNMTDCVAHANVAAFVGGTTTYLGADATVEMGRSNTAGAKTNEVGVVLYYAGSSRDSDFVLTAICP